MERRVCDITLYISIATEYGVQRIYKVRVQRGFPELMELQKNTNSRNPGPLELDRTIFTTLHMSNANIIICLTCHVLIRFRSVTKNGP